jgi:hypothetical protein
MSITQSILFAQITYSNKHKVIYTRQATRKAEAHHSWLPMININNESNNTTQAEYPV